jgi:hypothetical protein
VRGIPTLVFVNANGQTISTNGRAIVASDPTAAKFPWTTFDEENPNPLSPFLGCLTDIRFFVLLLLVLWFIFFR